MVLLFLRYHVVLHCSPNRDQLVPRCSLSVLVADIQILQKVMQLQPKQAQADSLWIWSSRQPKLCDLGHNSVLYYQLWMHLAVDASV